MEKLTEEQQQRLKKYLQEKGITKYRIAHETNLSATTISNYLNGNTKPDQIKWGLVRKYLGITDEWLQTGLDTFNNSPASNSPDDNLPAQLNEKIEEIRRMFQSRDDQYLNLHKDLEKLFRLQQEILTALSALLTKSKK